MRRAVLVRAGTWTLFFVSSQAAAGLGTQEDVSGGRLEAFLQAAEQAARTYPEPEIAIGDGYRVVGPETPEGGRTWINTSLMIHRTLDPTRPSGLLYATIADRPKLVAVLWALPAERDASLLPLPEEAWRLVGDCGTQTVAGLGPLPVDGAGFDGGCLVAVRAWIGLENPQGILAWENWALPLARAGILVTEPIPSAAGRAVVLGADPDALLARIPERGRHAARSVLSPWIETARAQTAELDASRDLEAGIRSLAQTWIDACEDLIDVAEKVHANGGAKGYLTPFGCSVPP